MDVSRLLEQRRLWRKAESFCLDLTESAARRSGRERYLATFLRMGNEWMPRWLLCRLSAAQTMAGK